MERCDLGIIYLVTNCFGFNATFNTLYRLYNYGWLRGFRKVILVDQDSALKTTSPYHQVSHL